MMGGGEASCAPTHILVEWKTGAASKREVVEQHVPRWEPHQRFESAVGCREGVKVVAAGVVAKVQLHSNPSSQHSIPSSGGYSFIAAMPVNEPNKVFFGLNK